MVAEGTWSFMANRLAPHRAAEEGRRRALSLWLLGAMASLAWLGLIAAVLVVKDVLG